jgi:hypothetical protein
MSANLETLLQRIRDGVGSSEEVTRARELVASDARLPDELREIALRDDDDLEADAAGLLSVLGADDLGALIAQAIQAEAAEPLTESEVDDGWQVIAEVLREGLAREASDVDVAEPVLRRIAVAGWAFGPVVASAVRSEAGEVDVARPVMRELSLDAAAPVAQAVAAEAGDVDVVDAVMATLSLDAPVPVAEAVRAEAGEIDVVSAVLTEIGAVAPPVVVHEPVAVPAPANDTRGWSWAGLAMAAVALVSVVVGALSLPGSETMTSAPMMFAHAGEVVVEDLSYGDDVQVFQTEGDQGAVILWVDEEA